MTITKTWFVTVNELAQIKQLLHACEYELLHAPYQSGQYTMQCINLTLTEDSITSLGQLIKWEV